jgi:hypothetical protein
MIEMFLLAIAGILSSIAGATTVATASIPVVGIALTTGVTALGTVVGTSVGTAVVSAGATAMTASSVGTIAGTSTIIASNAAIHKAYKEISNSR